jgi:hypothetical protein
VFCYIVVIALAGLEIVIGADTMSGGFRAAVTIAFLGYQFYKLTLKW